MEIVINAYRNLLLYSRDSRAALKGSAGKNLGGEIAVVQQATIPGENRE